MKKKSGSEFNKSVYHYLCIQWVNVSLAILLILMAGLTDTAARQITLQENFEDQDLSQNPAWTGDLHDFSFVGDFESILLRLDTGSSPNRSQIRTASATAYGSWEFYVQVAATSIQNRVYLYLMSDSEELDIVGSGSPSSANGYAIHTGSGHFDLVKISNGNQSEVLLSSNTTIVPDTGYQVKVNRDETGEWGIYVGEGYGTEPVLDSGYINDQTFSESEYFGIYVRYSSTNVQGYLFDNIIITGPDGEDDGGEGEEGEGSEDGQEDEDDSDQGESDEGNGENGDSDGEDGGEEGEGSEDGQEDEDDSDQGESDEGNGENGDSDGEDGGEEGGDGEGESGAGEYGQDQGESDSENDESSDGQDDSEGEADETGDESQEDNSDSDDSGEGGSDGQGEEEDTEDTESGDDFGPENTDPLIRPGELLISEFYYRVPTHWRTEAYDRPQYIELYNRSDNQLNLRNLQISGQNISIDKDLIMEPEEYLVIARGVPVFENRFGPRNFTEADQFPRYNLTTTGTITLENAHGETLEELTFSANEWGGNGVSLERLSFDLSAGLRGNWEESADALTGSPGLPNTVTIPVTPPVAESITVLAPRTIQVAFSRELDKVTSSDLSNFIINHDVVITSVDFLSGGSLLQISAMNPFEQLTNYTFTYQHVKDIFGNSVDEAEQIHFSFENPFKIQSVTISGQYHLIVQFTLPVNLSNADEAVFRLSNGTLPDEVQFTNSKTARLSFGTPFTSGSYELIVNQLESFDPDLSDQWVTEPNSSFSFFKFDEYSDGDIIINEFMYRPPGGYPRYIELYNRSGKLLNLNEWQIRRREGTPNNGGMISTQYVPLNGGEYLVITTDLNLMESVFGMGRWIEMSGFPGFTQTTADQIRLISPDGQIQEKIEYEPSIWGGNGVALERRSLKAPVSHPGNWGESNSESLGTPGLTNSVGPNGQPPVWVGAEVSGSKTIEITFEGPFDPANITPNHFSINGGLNVARVHIDEFFKIILTLDSDMISGVTYQLDVAGIRDIFGNEMSAQQRTVVFYRIESAEPGDVVINEFMYNEPDDYSRYIELYNRSNKIINLAGWKQANNTGTRRILTDDKTLLHPNEYVVITPDENLLFFFPELQIKNVGNRLSALKNGGDSIIIESSDAIVIDSLTYTPDWGGSGVSLERKSVDVPAYYRENWSESISTLQGTPGEPNTAMMDTDPPEIITIQQLENRGFIIELSKRPDRLSALNPENYQLRPSVNLSAVELSENYIHLMIYSELVNNETYAISISGITDIFGNMMERAEVSIRFLRLSDVRERDVVINEILYRRKEAGSPEFVELFNQTDKNFDLSGWTLSNSTGSVKLPEGLLISAKQYLVFTDSELLASESEAIIQLSGFRSLNNSSDIVKLSDRAGKVIDSLRYQSSWYNNPPGVSLERRDPAALSIDPYNWLKSSDPRGSTPGAANSRFEIDKSPPDILFVNLFHPDSLEVIFNKFIDLSTTVEKSDFSVSIRSQSQPEVVETPSFYVNGRIAPILWYNPMDGRRVVIGPGHNDPEDEMILTIDHIVDYSGNTAFELRSPIARPLKPGDLVFNEIMYQPITDQRDGMPDQSEYIEIFNRRSYPISLEGIFLHNEPDNRGNYSVISPVSSTRKRIPGQGYLLFYPEITNTDYNESRVATFFGLGDVERMIALRTDRNALSLPNTGRQIFLADSSGNTIDWVDYSPDWHNPNLIDVRGIALERINPDMDTNDPSNWGSSANIEGGTPGQKNSIYQSPERMSENHGVFLNPNPFSPDGSGFQDHLFISYKLDEPDYLIRIRIFDRYGRLVRNLVHGEPAGFEGSFIWDGRTDDGQTNRIGIYIILLEAYNSSAGKTLQFKETAVLARQF